MTNDVIVVVPARFIHQLIRQRDEAREENRLNHELVHRAKELAAALRELIEVIEEGEERNAYALDGESSGRATRPGERGVSEDPVAQKIIAAQDECIRTLEADIDAVCNHLKESQAEVVRLRDEVNQVGAEGAARLQHMMMERDAAQARVRQRAAGAA